MNWQHSAVDLGARIKFRGYIVTFAMSSNNSFGAALFGVPAGIYFFFTGFKRLSEHNLILDTPTSTIRGMAMGLVEVKGEAVPLGQPMLSPFSASPCVYYRYTIEEYVHSGKSSHWDTIKSEESGVDFLVDDGTGRVEVNPRGAEVDIPFDHQFDVNPGQETPDGVLRFLQYIGLPDNKPKMFLGLVAYGENERRYTEWFIAPGDNLYVMGTALPKPGVISDKNEEQIVITKGLRTPFFYISDSPEKKVLEKMAGEARLSVIGGAIVTLISLVYIFAYLKVL